MKKILLLFSIIVLVSCNKENANLVELEQDIVRNEISSLRINSESNVITSDEAINVVKLADIMGKATTKSTSKQIADVVTISDDNGAPLMYAVNYANGQGYTLVSATKEFYPILAQVDKGSFKEDVFNTGVSIFMEDYGYAIKNIGKLPQEKKVVMEELWYPFVNKFPTLPVPTKLDDFDSFIVNTLQGWQNDENVHDYYSLAEAQTHLPSSLYSTFCAVAEGNAHPDYDYMTYSYVVETIDRVDYNPNNFKLTTLWDQDPPYNNSVDEYDELGNPLPVGCSSVAMGQIMKYYEWPNDTTRFKWDDMPNSLYWYLESESVLSKFLEEIAKNVRIPGSDIAASSYDNVYNSFRSDYNYKCSALYTHNYNRVITSLINDKLVYMSGREANSESGHSWVCDGYGNTTQQIVYKLYVIALSSELEYVQAGSPECGEIINSGHYFHVNWGYGGIYNGWYIDGENITSGIMNHNVNRKDIVDIEPND